MGIAPSATQHRLLDAPDLGLGSLRCENSLAMCGTDAGHDVIQQRVVGGSVIDDVGQPMMQQIGVNASVDWPVGIDLSSELGTQESPSDLVELLHGQLDAVGRRQVISPPTVSRQNRHSRRFETACVQQ